MLNVLLSYCIAFLFGALLGNFTTTIYYRLPRKIQILGFDEKANSPPMCSNCKTRLKFYEYLPILSWISTFGKCNYCHSAIDRSYIALEIAVGVMSVLIYFFLGFTESFILILLAFTILFLNFALYLKYEKIWPALTISFMLIGIILRALDENTVFNCLINLLFAAIIIIGIFKKIKKNKFEELIFLMLSTSIYCNFYIFSLYSVALLVFYFIGVIRMKKRHFLYYGGVLALFIIIFFNYVMPKNFSFFSNKLPAGFVYLSDIAPDIVQDVKYATQDNFTGYVVPGYQKGVVILTQEAAVALVKVQTKLKKEGLGLKVFDAYRPVRAVQSFKDWALSDKDNQEMKAKFYPNIDKKDLLNGYISEKSTHSRGSTVDLTIIDAPSGKEIDMGTRFDFLDVRANTDFEDLPENVKQNRALLKDVMESNGFEGYRGEWWHFQLKNEPYPEDRFDFLVQ